MIQHTQFEPTLDSFLFGRNDLIAAVEVVRRQFAATPQSVWPLLCIAEAKPGRLVKGSEGWRIAAITYSSTPHVQ